MESLVDLDRRAVRFVERHWTSVQVAALAVVAGLAAGGIAASVAFGMAAALRAAVLTALGGGAAIGTTVLTVGLLLPDADATPARAQRGTRS